jgi:hypothetical protein
MGNLFVKERLVDPYIVTIDSTLLKAKGHLWHKSSMIRVVPHSGIDTDARWGFSHTKGWIFGYKLHITSSTGSLIVPLSADFTQADVQDNQIYPAITLPSLPQGVRYMAADSGYDDRKLYDLSTKRGFELVCPVSEIYNNTSNDRLQLIEFYESELGQIIYSWRGISVEPLIEHIVSHPSYQYRDYDNYLEMNMSPSSHSFPYNHISLLWHSQMFLSRQCSFSL